MKDMGNHIEEAHNEFLISRRLALGAGIGAMLVPVSGLVAKASAATATEKIKEAAEIDDFIKNIPNICRVATQTVEGPYYIKQSIIRSDIRDGEPGRTLHLNFQVIDANTGCKPVTGALVSIWHCNAKGQYSGYIHNDPNFFPNIERVDEKGHYPEETPERFLRGAQTTDAEGKVSFTTIFPGWYTPRAIHIHVRVYLNDKDLMTTQIYFPQEVIDQVLTLDEAYKDRGATIFTNENDMVRRQSGISGQEDIIKVTVNDDGSLAGFIVLAASHI
ncbi:protocatechuate 3,4-dioxygenase beta subunit [Ochrobactrum intermedium]|uniref:Protocatechuate 3,4-dioxygenase beta subunit n=1 Tax=Brucella intermedia TaxID=94625 RepID=A0ABR6AVT1_9HYPH|nr:intradiol ring-cleavage dioxygenase [Brucella intermedia]MBA8853488.1 protocatechuate 3,4-dioxygenase beta subunit [Brucella intermedia]